MARTVKKIQTIAGPAGFPDAAIGWVDFCSTIIERRRE
jgi:hypothetical protein